MTYSIPNDGLSSTEGPGPERIREVLRYLYRRWTRLERAKCALEESQEPLVEAAESGEGP